MLGNVAKAASGLLLRAGCAARLLALAAMAAAAWPLAGRVEALMCVKHPGAPGVSAALWCLAVAVAFLVAVCPGVGEGGGWRRRLAGRAPFALWACLTWDGRVTAWRALLWALLWPAELLACLWVACWWLAAAAWAAMDFTLCRRGGGP